MWLSKYPPAEPGALGLLAPQNRPDRKRPEMNLPLAGNDDTEAPLEKRSRNPIGSEAEASLYIDGSGSERPRRLAKIRILDIGREVAWVDVQQVKDVEHVGLEFETRAFAQDSHIGKTEGFRDGGIDILVSGARKGVAIDSRRRDEAG